MLIKSQALLGLARALGAVRLDGRRGIAIGADYVHSFFDVYLKGQPRTALDTLANRYPEVMVEWIEGTRVKLVERCHRAGSRNSRERELDLNSATDARQSAASGVSIARFVTPSNHRRKRPGESSMSRSPLMRSAQPAAGPVPQAPSGLPMEPAMSATESGADIWSRWLLHTRHGGDPALEQIVRAELQPYAKRVLDGARLSPGMTLADIGAGEGLIAFHAIERIGPSLRVILTDVSVPMLRHAEALSAARDVRRQCSFLACPADDLGAIPDATVDAVTTRAVLAYVADKAAALREFYRILKPGGRLSLAEPIFYDDAIAASVLRTQTKNGQLDAIWSLIHRWKAAQFPDTLEGMAASPMTNFSERTLLESIRAARFVQPHMELHIDMLPARVNSWTTFLKTSPHPLAPTLEHILNTQFDAEERQRFEACLRAHVESGEAQCMERTAYFTAVKPAG